MGSGVLGLRRKSCDLAKTAGRIQKRCKTTASVGDCCCSLRRRKMRVKRVVLHSCFDCVRNASSGVWRALRITVAPQLALSALWEHVGSFAFSTPLGGDDNDVVMG